MKEIIYNPLENKIPSGAVKNTERIIFCIYINEIIEVNNLNIVIYNDKNSETKIKYFSKFSEKKDKYIIYIFEIEKLEIGLYFYYFEFSDNNILKYISNSNLDAKISNDINPWQLTVYDAEFETPDWIKGGIMYQIFPDRFERDINYSPELPKNFDERIIHKRWGEIPNSSLDTKNYTAKDFFMGNLDGIINKKEYINSLNIDMIYLNPIFESSENHRYSTADYLNIDPYLGNNEIFKKFCKIFKEDKINIILDGVFSHTGADSIYFNKYNRYPEIGAYNSMESKYYSWFKFINYPSVYESWWGFQNLPTLNKDNTEYINYISNPENGVLNFWQNIGIKGWRLDVVDELSDIFIDELRKAVKQNDKDCFIVGEVWEDASHKISYGKRRRYLLGKQIDSVMNYPWKNAIIKYLKNNDAYSFGIEILNIVNNYPTPALDAMMNILSTHDTERIITVLGTDVSKIEYKNHKDFILSNEEYKKAKELLCFASFLQFTLPGIPSIYYGDEIGMQGFKDPFNRQCFDSNNIDEEIYDYYKKLSGFRRKYRESFKTGFKLISSYDNVIVYLRNDILCIVNLSDSPRIIENIKIGEKIFGNKDIFFTDYGVVVGKKSYTAIKI